MKEGSCWLLFLLLGKECFQMGRLVIYGLFFFFGLLLFESELPAGHVQTDDDDGDD